MESTKYFSLITRFFPLFFWMVWASLTDPDPGSGAFWPMDPGFGVDKKSRYGSGMNIPDHISESLITIFFVKNWLSLWCGSGIRNLFDPGSGIRDGKNSDPGSWINIPDPQYWHWPESLCWVVCQEGVQRRRHHGRAGGLAAPQSHCSHNHKHTPSQQIRGSGTGTIVNKLDRSRFFQVLILPFFFSI